MVAVGRDIFPSRPVMSKSVSKPGFWHAKFSLETRLLMSGGQGKVFLPSSLQLVWRQETDQLVGLDLQGARAGAQVSHLAVT